MHVIICNKLAMLLMDIILRCFKTSKILGLFPFLRTNFG